MILTCPACGTRYQTDSLRLIPPGRNVRCAKCGEVWFQAYPEAETEPEPEPAPIVAPPPPPMMVAEPPAMAEAVPQQSWRETIVPAPHYAQPQPRPPAPRGGSNIVYLGGWAALAVLVTAICWATVQYRDTIASLWPQSASLYTAIGLEVNGRGLALSDVAYAQEYEDGQPVLAITGRIVNQSAREMPVPDIRVVLFDDAKHELYRWTFDTGVATLKPGTATPFNTRLASPPAEARNLDVRFAEAGEKP